MEVKTILRWTTCGQGPAEKELLKVLDKGEIKRISGLKLIEIIKLRNLTKFGDATDINIALNPNKKYNTYYNFHSSSGFETKIMQEGINYILEIERPKGGGFCAFWSEVIIFEESNIVSFAKIKSKNTKK